MVRLTDDQAQQLRQIMSSMFNEDANRFRAADPIWQKCAFEAMADMILSWDLKRENVLTITPLVCPKCGIGKFSDPLYCRGDQPGKLGHCAVGEHLHRHCQTCGWIKTEPCKDKS